MIRNATENDLEVILDIMNHEIMTGTAVYSEKPQDLAFQKNWFVEKQRNNWPVFVHDINGNVGGYATYGPFRQRECYRYTVEHSVYVKETFRGKGIGVKLMKFLIANAQEQGFHSMIGGIDAVNDKSIRFHTQLGFQEVARMKEVGFKFDKWLHLVFMQLMLQ